MLIDTLYKKIQEKQRGQGVNILKVCYNYDTEEK